MEYKTTARVERRVWGPGDDYSVVQVQVDSHFRNGAEVEVIIRDGEKGHWTWQDGVALATCSICGDDSLFDDYPFCPNCGAPMEVEE